jgi:hypothetical protein
MTATTGSLNTPLARLRAVLVEAGLTSDAIDRAAAFPAVPGSDLIERALERTNEPSRLNTILHLFVIGGSVLASAAADALSPLSLDDLMAAGLLEPAGDRVRSVAALDPFGGLLIAHDFRARRSEHGQSGGTVLGIGASTRLLAGLTVRRGGETVLDMGTGQGFQALLAANHARRVIGTDVNPRALRAAALSAVLNGCEIELREGSLFEPVKEMTGCFDLIVSNPPYVITPRHNVVALSGDSEGDSLVERVVRQAPAYLAEGGFACFLASWAHQTDGDWGDRPREWTQGSGCDVLLLRSRAQDARQYAVQWIDESEGIAGIGSVPSLPQWLEYFDRLGFRRFSMGAVVLRKRSGGKHWFGSESCLEQRAAEAGAQVRRIFDGRTHLASLPRPDAVLDSPVVFTGAHELVEHRRAAGGRWSTVTSKLRQSDGFEFAVGVDSALADLLVKLDGKKAPRRIIADAARLKNSDAGLALVQATPFLHRMLELGYLVPVGAAGA